MKFILDSVNKRDLFFDVGANAGVYSILVSGACGARSIAIEPCDDALRSLSLNIRANDLSNRIYIEKLAITNKPGYSFFSQNLGPQNHLISSHRSSLHCSVSRVRTTSIDSLSRKYGTPTCIKVDVEGHEHCVLQGATRTLKDSRLRWILIELLKKTNKTHVNESIRLLKKAGFMSAVFDPKKMVLQRTETNWKSNKNYLFVRF